MPLEEEGKAVAGVTRPGVLAQCKGFLDLQCFMKKRKKKKTIFDHFEPSVKQISPFFFTLHMSISVYTPYKNLKSN